MKRGSQQQPQIRTIALDEFIERLATAYPDQEFVFFLGAGCSRSSGIPTASDLVNERWMPELRRTLDKSTVDVKFPNYAERYASTHYARAFEELYPTAEQRQREIERLVEERYPGIGYVILAQLMSHEGHRRRFHMVLTTNFDDLIQDALYLYANRKPLVVTHESLISFVNVKSARPTVIKLHGDARIAPKNSEVETGKLRDEVENKVLEILKGAGIIFIGYSGGDRSIARILSKLEENNLSGGIYWLNNHLPNAREMRSWLTSKRNAYWIKNRDFDGVMMAIHARLLDASFLLERSEFRRLISRSNTNFFSTLFQIFRARPVEAGRRRFRERVVKDWRNSSPEAARLTRESLATDLERAYFEQYINGHIAQAEVHYLAALKGRPIKPEIMCDYLDFLIENKGDAEAESSLREAIREGLVVDGQRDEDGLSPLALAAAEGRHAAARLLLRCGARHDLRAHNGKTALILAAVEGHLPIVRFLLEEAPPGLDIDAEDEAGYSAFLGAASSGHLAVVQYLAEKGANTGATIKDGGTALMAAAYNGHLDVVKYLVECGADVNHENAYGTTALIWATHKGHLETSRVLIQNGATVNVQNHFGKTPLMEAVLNGHTETVKLLLESEADMAVRSLEGETALDQARERQFPEIIQLLEQRGPSPSTRAGEQAPLLKGNDKVITILFLAANPSNTTRLRVDEEFRNIRERLRQSDHGMRYKVEQEWAVRTKDIAGHLMRYKPQIVHFSGHGSQAGEIILEDSSGLAKPVSNDALERLFRVLKDNIRCVVLNACFSQPQAAAIASAVDAVIGMSKAIGDEDAIAFSTGFYEALGFGRSIEDAFQLGCTQINLDGLAGHETPQLIAPRVKAETIFLISADDNAGG